MKLGERIKFIRGSLSLSDFSRKLSQNSKNVNFPTTNLSKYEKGIVYPSYNFFLALNEVFDVDLNWVITGRGLKYKADKMDYEAEAEKIKKLLKKVE